MKELCFVFCHGFALDARYWQPLRVHCHPHQVVCLELGYWQSPVELNQSDLQGQRVVGVGHSLGFLKLLQSGLRFDYLIGLNAFRHFLGFDAVLARRRKRELAQLTRQLVCSPQQALPLFYQRSGLPAPEIAWSNLHLPRLLADLEALAQAVVQLPNIPQLILAAKDDRVVPPELVWDNFGTCEQVTLEWLPFGQHGLGFWESEVVYQRLMSFIHAT